MDRARSAPGPLSACRAPGAYNPGLPVRGPRPLAWIRLVEEAEATGRLKRAYDAAVGRAGRVFGIVRAMSLAPAVLDASMGLYQRVMFEPEGLERYQRELLAVVVSRANDCHY